MKKQKVINKLLYNDVTPLLTSASSPTPYSITLGSQADNDTWNIFDGDISTSSRNSINCSAIDSWWYIDLGENLQVDAYSLYWGNASYVANAWQIEGSNDATTWDVIDVVEPFIVTSDSWIDFVIDSPNEYRYYKMQPTSKKGDNSITWYEMKLWQSAPQPVKMYKTLEKNMPSYTNEQEIHFTEMGNIYCSKNDGSFIKMNGEDAKPYEEQNALLREEITQIMNVLDVVNGKVVTIDG